jgi:hypothetical protein
MHARLGMLELKVLKLRSGTYFPSFLEPRRLTEQALVAVIQEAWIGGISTCKVDDLVQALGMMGISKSPVSAFCRDFRLMRRPVSVDPLISSRIQPRQNRRGGWRQNGLDPVGQGYGWLSLGDRSTVLGTRRSSDG